jgi:hypothetical protein
MYFRLEVTVLPLPFFSSTWQHGRRKLLAYCWRKLLVAVV